MVEIEIETPLGVMLAGAVDEGICLLQFKDKADVSSQFRHTISLLKTQPSLNAQPWLESLQAQLFSYFNGETQTFSIPLFFSGTPFQQKVWQALMTIPHGSTRSYKQQALALKSPQAIRAVAHANALNPIAIVVPCHRIIGSNGTLTGYAGGLWRKQFLLELENKQQVKLPF